METDVMESEFLWVKYQESQMDLFAFTICSLFDDSQNNIFLYFSYSESESSLSIF